MAMVTLNTQAYGLFFADGEQPPSLRFHSHLVPQQMYRSDLVVPFSVDRAFLESSIHTVRTGMLHGAELSTALAGHATRLVDMLQGDADAVGAANTVYLNGENALVGMNTHVAAVRELLTPRVHESGRKAPMAMVFGTGYATRVAIWALLPLCGMICIVSRNPDSMNAGMAGIERMLGKMVSGPRIETSTYADAFTDPYDIIVNATPMGSGMNRCSPATQSESLCSCTPRKGQIYLDMPIGYGKSVFIPESDGVVGICGLSVAALSAAISYTAMSHQELGARGTMASRYLAMAGDIYAGLPKYQPVRIHDEIHD